MCVPNMSVISDMKFFKNDLPIADEQTIPISNASLNLSKSLIKIYKVYNNKLVEHK